MITVERFADMIQELDDYYTNLDTEAAMLRAALDEMYEQHQNDSAFVQKTEQMRILAQKSAIHVFRYFPFWFSFSGARPRDSWAGFYCDGGMYVYNRNAGKHASAYWNLFLEDREQGFLHNWNNPVGLDHHALHYGLILQHGLSGLRAQVRAAREACTDAEKFPFYDAAEETLCILRDLSLRFAARATEMLAQETDPAARENLARIAETAVRVPEQPAETFYEALAAIVFCRECVGTLEGIGVSTYGRLDLLLQPYLERDIANGILTEQQALDWIEALLMYTGVRFTENEAPAETSTTIVLGGCDRDGNIVYNDMTRIILQAELECRVANVKLDARVSQQHPKEYMEWLCKVQLAGLPVLVFMNDETHIAARVKYGQDIHDARDYVAGGCHEYVLSGTEICSRADTWINLPRLLLKTLQDKEYTDFESLYRASIADIRAYHDRIAAAKSAFAEHWAEYAPMPLYSTMMLDCIAKGKDITAGGARYTSNALSMLAPATFVDSLYAIKVLCFDEKRLTVAQLREILDRNFAEDELLRQHIIHKIPKYGTGNTEVDAFSAKVLHDLSTVSGQENALGEKYYPAFYAHDIFLPLGKLTGATPDGRKKGFALSRGTSPSEFLSDVTPTDMIRSAEKIDFTDFTDSFALEMTLPTMDPTVGLPAMMSLVDGFLKAGGSTLQFNLLDRQRLLDAQQHPEQHRDLLVRICGYSFYFVRLPKEKQDEIIARSIRAV